MNSWCLKSGSPTFSNLSKRVLLEFESKAQEVPYVYTSVFSSMIIDVLEFVQKNVRKPTKYCPS